MKGRRPKPTALHRLQGTFKRTRHRDACQAFGEVGDAPADFTESQREIWFRAVVNAPAGVLCAIDREVLSIWCEAADRHRKARIAQAEMDANSEFPLLRRDPRTGEIRASPYIRELTRAGETMLRCAQALGFSPVLEGGRNSDETA